MRQNLPSLTAITAFEAAARYLSFTRAAAALNVLQPAISRQIRMLESDLGVLLFERTKPYLTLTADGQRFYTVISGSLDAMEQAAGSIRQQGRMSSLTVNVSIGIASCWLMARLAGFRTLRPDIDIRLVTRDTNSGFDLERSDLVVRFGDGRWPGVDARLLFPEVLFPICSPAYRLPTEDRLNVNDLHTQRLLFLDDVDHRSDWSILLDPLNSPVPDMQSGTSFNSYIVYLQAIMNGEGIGLGWDVLMRDHLMAGRLYRPSDLMVQTKRGYFCMLGGTGRKKEEARVFMDWLVGLGQSEL